MPRDAVAALVASRTLFDEESLVSPLAASAIAGCEVLPPVGAC